MQVRQSHVPFVGVLVYWLVGALMIWVTMRDNNSHRLTKDAFTSFLDALLINWLLYEGG